MKFTGEILSGLLSRVLPARQTKSFLSAASRQLFSRCNIFLFLKISYLRTTLWLYLISSFNFDTGIQSMVLHIWKTRFVGSVEIQTCPTTRHWSLVIEKVFSPRRLLGLPLCGARHPVPWPTTPRKSLHLVSVTLLHPQKSPGRTVNRGAIFITANVPLATADL